MSESQSGAEKPSGVGRKRERVRQADIQRAIRAARREGVPQIVIAIPGCEITIPLTDCAVRQAREPGFIGKRRGVL